MWRDDSSPEDEVYDTLYPKYNTVLSQKMLFFLLPRRRSNLSHSAPLDSKHSACRLRLASAYPTTIMTVVIKARSTNELRGINHLDNPL